MLDTSLSPKPNWLQSSQAYPGSGNTVNDVLRQLNQMIIYDPSVMSLTSGATAIGDILEAAKRAVTSKRPYFFRFFINPSTVAFSLRKTSKPILEKKGWDIVHFDGTPNEMIPLKFGGNTGSIVPPIALWNKGIRETKFSVNYQRFQQLFELARTASNDLKLFYDGKLYEGAFSDFSFDENANEPFSIRYSFTFMTYPDRTKNITSFSQVTSLPIASAILQAGVPI